MTDEVSAWEAKDPIPTQSNYSSILTQRFTAGVGQTAFILTSFAYAVGINTLMIFKDGVLLEEGIDYTELTSTTFSLAVGAVGGEVILVIGFLGAVGAVNDLANLGSQAAAPVVDTLGVALSAIHEGYFYWNSTSNNHWTWTGAVWQLTSSSIATSANLVALADAGGNYASPDVEAALAELASATTGEGASIIKIEDAGSFFTSPNVEGALQETEVKASTYRGSYTVVALAAGGTDALTTITHGLGTDDVDFEFTVFGSRTIALGGLTVAASMMGTDKRYKTLDASAGGGNFPLPADGNIPGAGDVKLFLRNNHGSAAQDVTVNYTIRKRT